MKVIYCCRTGAHASVVAAAIHLGLLPMERTAEAEELERLPHFTVQAQGTGAPAYMGSDEKNHQVYALGVGKDKHLVTRIAESFVGLYGILPQEVRLVDVERPVSPWLGIAAYLLGRLGATKLQKKVVIYCLQRDYPYLAEQAKQVRDSLK